MRVRKKDTEKMLALLGIAIRRAKKANENKDKSHLNQQINIK